MKRTATAAAVTGVLLLVPAAPASALHGWPHHVHEAERIRVRHDAPRHHWLSEGDVLSVRLARRIPADRRIGALGVVVAAPRLGQMLVACNEWGDRWRTRYDFRAWCRVSPRGRYLRFEVFHAPRQAGELRLRWFRHRPVYVFDWAR